MYIAFTAYLVTLVFKQVTQVEASELKAEVSELTPEKARSRPWVSLGLVVAGVALLAAGAEATVSGASDLARLLGWSDRSIGLTIVRRTGLPEVVASLVSSVRGRSDIAIGNVIGSNLFNILAILGLSAMAAPLPVQPELVAKDCLWMFAMTILLFPIMLSGLRINRWEGGLLLTVHRLNVHRMRQ